MSDCNPAEIAAYEVVRQRLRALVAEHPWILDIPIADERRTCLYCDAVTCVENPPDAYYCRTCRREWAHADVVRVRSQRRRRGLL